MRHEHFPFCLRGVKNNHFMPPEIMQIHTSASFWRYLNKEQKVEHFWLINEEVITKQ